MTEWLCDCGAMLVDGDAIRHRMIHASHVTRRVAETDAGDAMDDRMTADRLARIIHDAMPHHDGSSVDCGRVAAAVRRYVGNLPLLRGHPRGETYQDGYDDAIRDVRRALGIRAR